MERKKKKKNKKQYINWLSKGSTVKIRNSTQSSEDNVSSLKHLASLCLYFYCIFLARGLNSENEVEKEESIKWRRVGECRSGKGTDQWHIPIAGCPGALSRVQQTWAVEDRMISVILWFIMRNIYLVFIPVSGTEILTFLKFPNW